VVEAFTEPERRRSSLDVVDEVVETLAQTEGRRALGIGVKWDA